jgi:arginine/lysine/histidine/glutamine transport system ATP-binding protein
MQFARDVASRVIFLDRGRIEEEGPAHQTISNPQCDRLKAFLSRMERN